jgi:broad specificity phosphatase PhoE
MISGSPTKARAKERASRTERRPDRTCARERETDSCATLYLVRHGETEWNTKDILQGQLDSALTERGLQQARELVKQLEGIHFDAILSSDLLRAKRTAETIAVERKLAVSTSQLLRERSWGRYDGREAKIFREECRHLIERMKELSEEEHWKFKYFEDIESFEEVFARFSAFLREAAIAYAGKTILVVSHLDVLGALLLHLGYKPTSIGNLSWVKLRSDGLVIDYVDSFGITFARPPS